MHVLFSRSNPLPTPIASPRDPSMSFQGMSTSPTTRNMRQGSTVKEMDQRASTYPDSITDIRHPPFVEVLDARTAWAYPVKAENSPLIAEPKSTSIVSTHRKRVSCISTIGGWRPTVIFVAKCYLPGENPAVDGAKISVVCSFALHATTAMYYSRLPTECLSSLRPMYTPLSCDTLPSLQVQKSAIFQASAQI